MAENLTSAQYLLGEVVQQLGRHDEAIALFREVILTEPQDAATHLNLGVSLAAVNRRDEAIHAFAEAVRIEPDWIDASSYLGITYMEAGQLDRARPWLQKVVRLRGSRDDYVNLGMNLHKVESLDEAEAAFRKALTLDTTSRDVRLQLAAVLMDQRRFEDALDVLNNAKRGYSDALVQSLKSVVLVELGRFDVARHAALRATELGPAVGEAHASLGYFHFMAGDALIALEEFDRAVQVDPNRPDFLVGKAAALSKNARHAEAVALFTDVLATDPKLLEKSPELRAAYDQSLAAVGHPSRGLAPE